VISRAPKIKLMKEHGRDMRLDADAEEIACPGKSWSPMAARTRELCADIIAVMRDTGMKTNGNFSRCASRIWTRVGVSS